jgi:TPR repeat protein
MTPRLIHAAAAGVCLLSLAVQTGDALAFRRVPVSLSEGGGVGPVIPDSRAEKAAAAAEKAAAAAARRVRVPKPVDPMKEIRNRMVARGEVSYEELQMLADSGDDLAAYFLARRLEESGEPEAGKTAMHYYARAALSGRAAAIRPMVRLLDARGEGLLPPALLADAQAALEAQAVADNAMAVDALVRYYIEGTPFGSDPDRAKELLTRSAQGGNARIALELALQLLSGDPTAEEQSEAIRYLELAALSDNLGTRTMAENLLRGLGTPIVASTELVAPIPATRKALQ